MDNENYESVLTRCANTGLEVGTQEYNLINGPVEMFKSFVLGILDNEKEHSRNFDVQTRGALEHIYSELHSSDISPSDRINICKEVGRILEIIKDDNHTTKIETTKRMIIAAATMLGAGILAIIGRPKPKHWWE